jgi:hypothetical protein
VRIKGGIMGIYVGYKIELVQYDTCADDEKQEEDEEHREIKISFDINFFRVMSNFYCSREIYGFFISFFLMNSLFNRIVEEKSTG